MASSEPRYTDDHAKAGLEFAFPAIETWQNQFPGYEIVIEDPELTSVCPKTGLPDFGILNIRYMPRQRCLELKSLKEYLFSYRNLGIFQENIVNQVLEDVVKACDPVWAVVRRPATRFGPWCTAYSVRAEVSPPPSKPAGPGPRNSRLSISCVLLRRKLRAFCGSL